MMDRVAEEVLFFIAGRLNIPRPVKRPCLAENWWVEDRLAEGRRFPLEGRSAEEGLRLCWRIARTQRLTGEGAGDPDLLLHQFADLLPAILTRQFEQWSQRA